MHYKIFGIPIELYSEDGETYTLMTRNGADIYLDKAYGEVFVDLDFEELGDMVEKIFFRYLTIKRKTEGELTEKDCNLVEFIEYGEENGIHSYMTDLELTQALIESETIMNSSFQGNRNTHRIRILELELELERRGY